jgi:hypothetical protein
MGTYWSALTRWSMRCVRRKGGERVRAGITLVVIGAILAFAVRADASVVDLQTVGLIFMLAGAAVIAYARRERRTRGVVTHVEQGSDGTSRQTDSRQVATREVISDDTPPTSDDGYGRYGDGGPR